MGYQSTFLVGVRWNGALKIASKLISALKLAIMARLLSPKDFGIFSLVLVSISLVEVFTESGINTILVQSHKKIEEYVNTAWIFSIFRGIAIALIMIGLSFVLSNYYHEPSLKLLILGASLIPFVRGFINPAIITFYKELDFKKDTLYRISLVLIDFSVAVAAGFLLRSTVALILPIFVAALADVFISFRFLSIKPKLEFHWTTFSEIFHQTKWLNNISILDYLNKNADNLIVGRILGTTLLGFYQNAYALTQSATSELSLSVIHASFPIFTRLTSDTQRLRQAFFKVTKGYGLLLLIPTVLFMLFPKIIVQIQFGNQWLALAPILPILAASGYIQGYFNIGSSLLTAKKRYQFLSISLLVLLSTMVAGLLTFTPKYGLIGAAGSVLLARIITVPFYVLFTLKAIHTTSQQS